MSIGSDPRGSRPVRLIVVHTAEGALTTASLRSWFNQPGVNASSHAGADDHGIEEYVSYDRSAWTLRSGNPISDNLEMCGFARWTRDQWLNDHPALVHNAGTWIGARCRARNVPIVKLTSAEVAAGRPGVAGHYEWTIGMHDGTHVDPDLGQPGHFPWDEAIRIALLGGSPPPPPGQVTPGRFAWRLPLGHYYGNVRGPSQSHGGYYVSERDEVRNIQQWLIYHGCVAGVPSTHWASSTWADGRWESPTDTAMTYWHRLFYPNQPRPTQCWADDYVRLARV